jgi:tRNA (guanine-N7-)-methyltransferase
MGSSYEEILQEKLERKAYFSKLCTETFFDKTITLEIGCGHGHFLTSYAHAHPEKTCIGVDLCTQRIFQAKKKQERANLDNLHFIKADVIEFLEALPEPISIDEIFVLFPDPWPKTRHYKNRLIQENFLELLSRKSLVSSKLHFRTDHKEYFDWTINRIQTTPHWQLSNDAIWSFEEETIFQKKMKNYQSLIAFKS